MSSDYAASDLLADLPFCDVCGYDADCPACIGEADYDDLADCDDSED